MSFSLEARNLGKSYNQWGSEWRRIASWFNPSIKPHQQHWVLQDVNLAIHSGEAVGIVGQNGAGKSTLLKLVTGVVFPTQGTVVVNGRVAAILELGMGFNPELTGRQNARHAASLMGYSGKEIDDVISQIEAFAEVGQYFDESMRTYSSGMQMRVAFSVATAIRPDLLIVDEALSVGDSYFQHKSFDRIRQFKEDGSAILFVSHNMRDVRALCDRVVLLDAGKVIKDGSPAEVVDYYNAFISQKENIRRGEQVAVEQRVDDNGWVVTKSGNGEVAITSIRLVDAETGNEVAVACVDQELALNIKVAIHSDIPQLVIGCYIRNKHGLVVWGTNTWHTGQVQFNLKKGDLLDLSMKFMCRLGPDSYSVSLAAHGSDTHVENNYEWNENIVVFDVVNTNKPIFIGVNWIDASISIARQA